jgi:PhoPQ-activated pathogenicity-related protein
MLRKGGAITLIVRCALRTVRNAALVLLVFATTTPILAEELTGPLTEYVDRPDSSYGWVKRRDGELAGGRYVELTLTSQTWRDIAWKHQLFLIVPAEVTDARQALFLIGGGRWRPELDGEPETDARLPGEATLLALVAQRIKAPVAVILQVPFQPIFDGLVEDAAISFTFEQYLKTGEPDWPLLLPMVKSAVRGMDAVQEAARQEWQLEIERFTVTGGSKRGWTTWLAGAVDERATAIVPMVIDVLNMAPQMKHQVATWGTFSDEISDYTDRGIQQQSDSDAGLALNAIVDPYNYRDRLSQPKLILLGTNDRYWPLDALNLYWEGLEGEKRVLYVPNNGHSLKDIVRVAGSIAAFHKQASGQLQLPKLTWDLAESDEALRLSVRSDVAPTSVSAWIATAPTRDFREAVWTSSETRLDDGAHRYELDRPATGYAALFGEAVYDDDGQPYFLSTNIRIIGSPPARQD